MKDFTKMDFGKILLYGCCPRQHWSGPVVWAVCPFCSEPLDYYGISKLYDVEAKKIQGEFAMLNFGGVL